VWALRDLSFSVPIGQIVGLIGHNGAGKSVLLKILARVTSPTTGTAEIRGQVGAMLEAGAGFHPELSGRENIYLNGALLGMKSAEIARKLDAIVAFAGVTAALDTPVKRYSSGMNARLATAVAVHLEPEVLLIDEGLAVSDEAFRQRCLVALRRLAMGGSTVLIVSHQADIIERLCDRVLVLRGGRLVADAPPAEALALLAEQVAFDVEAAAGDPPLSPAYTPLPARSTRRA
jgi:lipopolysaccharide transport system ATP-binding protein